MVIPNKFYVLLDDKPVLPDVRCMRDFYEKFATSETYAYIMWHKLVEEGKEPLICRKIHNGFIPIKMGRHLMKGVDFDGVSLIKQDKEWTPSGGHK